MNGISISQLPARLPSRPVHFRIPNTLDWVDNGANERYNALQLYVRRTIGTNLFLNAGFTWAKDLTDAQDQSSFSGLEIQNAYDRAADKGPNSFVVPT
jgi:hypothetical protein